MFGRVRLYNLGFAIFTIGSTLCRLSQSGLELVLFRMVQATGSAFLFSNSAAILTDAFPANERGKALGINQTSIVAGAVTGLVLGGVLTETIGWRSIFWVNVRSVLRDRMVALQAARTGASLPWAKDSHHRELYPRRRKLLRSVGMMLSIIAGLERAPTTYLLLGLGVVLLVASSSRRRRSRCRCCLSVFRIRAFAAGTCLFVPELACKGSCHAGPCFSPGRAP